MTVKNVEFSFTLNSGNAAVVDDPHWEIHRLLRDVAMAVNDGRGNNDMAGPLKDSNGNTIGQWNLFVDEDNEEEDDDG